MATTKSGTAYYAKSVHQQNNPNEEELKNGWWDMLKAVDFNEGSAQSKYTQTSVKSYDGENTTISYRYYRPETISAHDFRLNVPSDAYVKSVKVEARMRLLSSKAKIKAPTAHFMIYGGNGKDLTPKYNGSNEGWDGTTWVSNPDQYLSTSFQNITYTIPGSAWNNRGYATDRLNKSIMGVDLHFPYQSKTMGVNSVGILLSWVRITVTYELPKYSLSVWSFDNKLYNSREFSSYSTVTKGVIETDVHGVLSRLIDERWNVSNASKSITQFIEDYIDGTETHPHVINVGEKYYLYGQFKNVSNVTKENQIVNMKLPFGTRIVSANVPYTVKSDGSVDLTVSGKANSTTNFNVRLVSEAYGLREVDFKHTSATSNVNIPIYIYPYPFNSDDYEEFKVEHGTIQDGKSSCFSFSAKVQSSDGIVNYDITIDGNNKTDWTTLSEEFIDYFDCCSGENIMSKAWKLEPSSIAQGVSLDETQTDANHITFLIDDEHLNKDIEIKFSACFITLFNGSNTVKVVGDNDNWNFNINSLSASPTRIKCTIGDTYWYDRKILSQITTDGYIIPIGVKEADKHMVERASTAKMHFWKKVPYIGCVPLEHSHYDPKSDYSNDLLKETYKNKTYEGKKGEIEEDISLNVKVRPYQVNDLQGLTKLDKPVPINTVPDAFEGDVLNHRGWVELTKVSAEKTNPLWYDTELEVDYLTHNINTRFKIQKGKQINNYGVQSISHDVIESGEEFARYTVMNDEGGIERVSGFFDVTTDGVYIYDPDEEDEQMRTLITMDNEQYLRIKSDQLIPMTDISMTWQCTKIEEDRENNIERIIYITDLKGNPVFKYQYHDFEWDTDDSYYKCTVTATRMRSTGVEEVVMTKEIVLTADVESIDYVIDSDGNIVQEAEPDLDELYTDDEFEDLDDTMVYSFNDYVYGSTLKLSLSSSHLTVVDTGYNGREISFETDLIGNDYCFDAQFQNHNVDLDTLDVIHFFDFEVQEMETTNAFNHDYKNVYVSAFPVQNKELLFTRECDEGIIFFYKDDNKPFEYIQEPFYMYFCGVDLRTRDGINLWDLNNSYTTFYLTNGLVRMGFNRISGDLYIGKFDLQSREWITVAYLHGQHKHFTIGAFSDDKIEVKAGSTIYTMYRGHPYVVINHPREDLTFKDKWHYVWAEGVNDEAYTYPVLWDLMNHDNLLPECVGSKNVSKTCLTFADNEGDDDGIYENPDVVNQLTLNISKPSEIWKNQVTIFTLTGTAVGERIQVLVDGEVARTIKVTNGSAVKTSDGKWSYQSFVTDNKFALVFGDGYQHTVRAVYVGDNHTHIAYTKKLLCVAKTGGYKLEIVKLPTRYQYMATPNWSWRLTKNGKPVPNHQVEIALPHGGEPWTKTTDSKGMVYIKKPNLANPEVLDQFRKWEVGTHVITARAYHEKDIVDGRWYESVSKTIYIIKNDPYIGFLPAGKKGKTAAFSLKDPQGYEIPNKLIKITVGGKTYKRTTNDKGVCWLTINKAGYKTYKLKYAGDKNLHSYTRTTHETVRK